MNIETGLNRKIHTNLIPLNQKNDILNGYFTM